MPSLFNESPKDAFLLKLKGKTQPYKRYLGSPIRYAGGKSLAVGLIIEQFPEIKRMISPFMGGGSVEIATALELNVEVKAYDIFDILVNFWNVAINSPEKLYNSLKALNPTRDTYNQIKEELKAHFEQKTQLDSLTLARDYYFNHNLSYGPGFLGWVSNIYLVPKTYQAMLDKLKAFGNHKNIKNLKVECQDFKQVIEQHTNDFLYLDPPYYLEGNSKMFNGIYPSRNITIHHKGFDHKALSQMLKAHKGQFILSYNDCEWVRDTYKGYRILEPKWQYTMGQGETRIGKNRLNRGDNDNIKQSHELLIIKD